MARSALGQHLFEKHFGAGANIVATARTTAPATAVETTPLQQGRKVATAPRPQPAATQPPITVSPTPPPSAPPSSAPPPTEPAIFTPRRTTPAAPDPTTTRPLGTRSWQNPSRLLRTNKASMKSPNPFEQRFDTLLARAQRDGKSGVFAILVRDPLSRGGLPDLTFRAEGG